MGDRKELACMYAALALQDEGVAVTGDKIQAILTAAGISIEPFFAGLYAKALDGVDVKAIISRVSSGVGSGSAPSAPAAAGKSDPSAAAAAPAKEEKKKQEEEEEDSDGDNFFGDGGLFD